MGNNIAKIFINLKHLACPSVQDIKNKEFCSVQFANSDLQKLESPII